MKKIFIKTYGCSLNQSDSERMKGMLKDSGRFRIADSIQDADLVIINSCTVKKKAETHFLKDIRTIKKPKVLAGCVPQAEKDQHRFQDYSILGPENIKDIVHVVQETLEGNTMQLSSREKEKKLKLPKVRRNPIIEIIPVSEGCLGSCAYCKVKQARGDLVSYPKQEVIKRLNDSVHEGIKEFWFTSQDMGCYGKDIGTTLADLLDDAVEQEGEYFIRVGMANPNHISDHLPRLIKLFAHPKVFRFLHIPVQSGNNDILNSMDRKYTVEEFKKIIESFRKNIPDITIATDIICGLPGESKEMFMDSVNLIKEIQPDVLNLSRFWPRPDTKAAKMENQIHGNETKKRSQYLNAVFTKISTEKNVSWIGWKGPVLVDEKGKGKTTIGRNASYKPVVLKGMHELGTMYQVTVRSATSYDLRE